MKLKLHTVSPIHIGTGNPLEPFEYIIEDGTYYRLNQNKAFGLALEKHPDFPEKFTNWLERTSARIEKTTDNAEQARIRGQFNFRYFCESVLNDPNLADAIIEKGYAYKCPIPYGLNGKNKVQELIKNLDNTPYIPGTSIKGALRTILAWWSFSNLSDVEKENLLNKVLLTINLKILQDEYYKRQQKEKSNKKKLDGLLELKTLLNKLFKGNNNISKEELILVNQDNDCLVKIIEEIQNDKLFSLLSIVCKSFNSWQRNLSTPIIEELFVCGTQKRTKDGMKTDYSDIKFDIMKFIHVTDALSDSAEMSVYPANLYLPDKEPQSQTPALETINFNSSFAFEISINEAEIRKIYEVSMKQNPDKWIGFDKKFKRMFEFYPHEIPNGKLEEKIIESIKKTINAFSKIQLAAEKKWLRSFEYFQSDEFEKKVENGNIDSLEKFYGSLSKYDTVFRIGWASGFNNTTIFSALIADSVGQNFLRDMFDKFKIGIPPKKKNDNTVSPPNIFLFPKSKRMSASDLMYPFSSLGWIVLLNHNEKVEKVEFEIKNLNDFNKKIAPQKEVKSIEEIVAQNNSRKIKAGDKIEAEVVKSESGFVHVKILREKGDLCKFKYASGIEVGKIIIVSISSIMGKEIIKEVKFHSME